MGDDQPTRRKGTQFSLLTLLLLTTIIALSVAVTRLNREVGPLRKEVARLRNEVGELHIEDPTKLHAIRVPTDNELEWKWRVWIPEGTRYRLRVHGAPVTKEGYPQGGGTISFHEPGEHVVRYLIHRNPGNEQWFGTLHTQTGSVGADSQPWVDWSTRTSTGDGVGFSTRSYELKEPLDLIRHRVSQAKSSADIEEMAAGFVVWLEPY